MNNEPMTSQKPSGEGCLTRDQIIAMGMDPDMPSSQQVPNPAERAPLLSSKQVKAICMMPNPCGPNLPEVLDRSMLAGANLINNFYEAKITSGELRGVVKAKNIATDAPLSFVCSACMASTGTGAGGWSKTGFPYRNPLNFCPGCGAEIVKG